MRSSAANGGMVLTKDYFEEQLQRNYIRKQLQDNISMAADQKTPYGSNGYE